MVVFLSLSVLAVIENFTSSKVNMVKTLTYFLLFIICFIVTSVLLLSSLFEEVPPLSQRLKEVLKLEYQNNPRVVEKSTKAVYKIIRTRIKKEKGLGLGLGIYLFLGDILPPVRKSFISLVQNFLRGA
jgi:hypothetical protein